MNYKIALLVDCFLTIGMHTRISNPCTLDKNQHENVLVTHAANLSGTYIIIQENGQLR